MVLWALVFRKPDFVSSSERKAPITSVPSMHTMVSITIPFRYIRVSAFAISCASLLLVFSVVTSI